MMVLKLEETQFIGAAIAIGNTYVRRDTNAKTHIHFSSNEYTKM